jgi:hypothetical protein
MGVGDAMLASYQKDETKRQFLDRFFEHLEDSPTGDELVGRIPAALSEQTSFPDLVGWEDSKQKIERARESVASLKDAVEKSQAKAEQEALDCPFPARLTTRTVSQRCACPGAWVRRRAALPLRPADSTREPGSLEEPASLLSRRVTGDPQGRHGPMSCSPRTVPGISFRLSPGRADRARTAAF